MLNRNAQVGLKVETTEGTEETLVAADFAGNRKDTNHTYQRAEYSRDLVRGVLTQQQRLLASYSLRVNYTEECAGGAAATAAPFHATLRGLGFSSVALQKNNCGTVTNTFVPGQLIGNNVAQGSATKLGRFVAVSGGALYYMPISGGNFTNAEVITGYGFTPAASTTLSGTASATGFGFRPLSETDSQISPSVTVERRIGGQRHTAVGARGTGSLSLRQNEPALLQAEFLGVPVYNAGTDLTPRLGSLLAVTTNPATAPRLARGMPLRLRTTAATGYTPICTELSFNISNTLAQRATITDRELQNATYNSGYMPTRITGREISATLDPEHILPADGFDFIGQLNLGTLFHLSGQVGALSEGNGLLIVCAPSVQLTGDHEPGDRDGVTTAPLQLACVGDQDDELFIFHAFA
jgi:hypothetical protein